MDLFRFTSPKNAPMRGGSLLPHVESITWAEGYRDPGEVTIVAEPSSGIQELLPIGTFLSHVNTKEIMRVETHHIANNGDEVSMVTITGRSLEAAALENRMVGSNIVWPTVGAPVDYVINGTWSTQTQAVSLINRHILAEFLEDDDDAFPYLKAETDITAELTKEERTISRGDVHKGVTGILDVDDLGIRVERPTHDRDDTLLVIHQGVDRSNDIVLTADRGDVVSAEYVWSDKTDKNCALIVGKFVQTRILGTKNKWDRRWMIVDASDIDQGQETVPSGAARSLIISAMQARGRQALAKQKALSIVSAEATQNATAAIFREDYEVGDIVMVTGNYKSAEKMRVIGYVETLDENGFAGYPTLKALEGET